LTGTDYSGHTQSRISSVLEGVTFLSLQQGVEAGVAMGQDDWKRGVATGMFVGITEAFGFRTTPDYDDPDQMKYSVRDEEKGAGEKKLKSMTDTARSQGVSERYRKRARKVISEMKRETRIEVVNLILRAASNPDPKRNDDLPSYKREEKFRSDMKQFHNANEAAQSLLQRISPDDLALAWIYMQENNGWSDDTLKKRKALLSARRIRH